jgi:hypothetical protein
MSGINFGLNYNYLNEQRHGNVPPATACRLVRLVDDNDEGGAEKLRESGGEMARSRGEQKSRARRLETTNVRVVRCGTSKCQI